MATFLIVGLKLLTILVTIVVGLAIVGISIVGVLFFKYLGLFDHENKVVRRSIRLASVAMIVVSALYIIGTWVSALTVILW